LFLVQDSEEEHLEISNIISNEEDPKPTIAPLAIWGITILPLIKDNLTWDDQIILNITPPMLQGA